MDTIDQTLDLLNVSVCELRRHNDVLKDFALEQRFGPIQGPTDAADAELEDWRKGRAHADTHFHASPTPYVNDGSQHFHEANHRARAFELAREALQDERERLRSELNALSMELAAARRSEEAALLHRNELEALVRELRGALAVAASEEFGLRADLAMQLGLVSSLENWKSARPGANLPSESSLLLLVRGDLGWGWPDRGFRLPHSQKLRR